MADVVIIGGAKEPEVRRLTECLKKSRCKPLIIDTAIFPQQQYLTYIHGSWRFDGYELDSVKAFFLRNLHCNEIFPTIPRPPEGTLVSLVDALPIIDALREKDTLLGSLLRWATRRNKLVLNPLNTLLCHYNKLDSLETLRNANIPIPDTLGSNHPDEVVHFARRYQHLVFKPLAGGNEAVAMSADSFTAEFLSRLQRAPIMLQKRIYGDDIRAYVLNNQVIAAASLRTELVDSHMGQQHFQVTTLTEAETADVLHAAKLMALTFSSIDFKRTQDGKHFLLDVNPAPMFAGFEIITGLDVATPVATYLMESSLA